MYKFSDPRRILKSRTTTLGILVLSLAVAPTATAADPTPAGRASAGAAPTPPAAKSPQTSAAPQATAPSAAPSSAPVPAPTKPVSAEPPSTAPTKEGATAGAAAASSTGAAPTNATPSEAEREEARLAFEAGTKSFESGDFAAAVTSFESAYARVPSPHAEYWIARALDGGDPAQENASLTATAYGRFLSNPGANHVGAEKVSEAQARLVELKKLIPAKVSLATIPAGANVTLDGQLQAGRTPLSVELAAGPHKLEISLDGYQTTLVDMNVEGGSTIDQEVTLKKPVVPVAPVAAVVAAPTAAPEERNIVPIAVTLGLSGAGLITGTVFGIMALSAKSEFNDNPTTENADAAERNALIADMSFGIAITLGITGLVLLTAEEDEEKPKESTVASRLRVAPYAGRKGGGLTGSFSF